MVLWSFLWTNPSLITQALRQISRLSETHHSSIVVRVWVIIGVCNSLLVELEGSGPFVIRKGQNMVLLFSKALEKSSSASGGLSYAHADVLHRFSMGPFANWAVPFCRCFSWHIVKVSTRGPVDS